ncbi:MAG: RluA family pseudouridine synthase [Dysosmobacter sp.]
MQTITIVITPREEGRKVRSVLKGRLGFSSHAIGGLTRRETGILVNGKRAFSTAILRAGDVLTVEIGDVRPPDERIIPCAVPLPIVYEDDYLLVVNKPAGMVALASSFLPETPTVAGALAYQKGETAVFHVVNRLDKGTTGLMAVAKSGYVHNLLRKLLHTPDFYREYRGVCVGCPEPPAGTIDLPIGRDETSTVRRCIRPDGAPSVSRYEVLETTGRFSLLRLVPETGRTHQLRLHMSAVGHPLAGDWLYGTEAPDLIPRPALHSCALHLRHPVTGEPLELTAPLPEDMSRVMEL